MDDNDLVLLDTATAGDDTLLLEGDLEDDGLEEETFGGSAADIISDDFDFSASAALEEDRTTSGVFTAESVARSKERRRQQHAMADPASAVQILSTAPASAKSKGGGRALVSSAGFMISDGIWSSGGEFEAPQRSLLSSYSSPSSQQPTAYPPKRELSESVAWFMNQFGQPQQQQAPAPSFGSEQSAYGAMNVGNPPGILRPPMMMAPTTTTAAAAPRPMTVTELEAKIRSSTLQSRQSQSQQPQPPMPLPTQQPPPHHLTQPPTSGSVPPGYWPPLQPKQQQQQQQQLYQQRQQQPQPQQQYQPLLQQQQVPPQQYQQQYQQQQPQYQQQQPQYQQQQPQYQQRYGQQYPQPSYQTGQGQMHPHPQPIPYAPGGGGGGGGEFPQRHAAWGHPSSSSSFYSSPRNSSADSFASAETRQQHELYLRQAHERMRKRAYDGLMSAREKFLIVRIHSSQLQVENPLKDDYYYHVYMLRHADPLSEEQNRYLVVTPSAQRRPNHQDNTPFTREGALGVIPRHSINRPRQLLQVLKNSEDDQENANVPSSSPAKAVISLSELSKKTADPEALTRSLQLKCLRQIEDIYQATIEYEDSCMGLDRLGSEPPSEDPEEDEMNQRKMDLLTQRRDSALLRLPGLLFVDGDAESVDSSSLIQFLRFSKAKKSLGRALRLLTPDKAAKFVRLLFSVLDRLDVVDRTVAWNDDQQYFLTSVIPSLKEVVRNFNGELLLECMEGMTSLSLVGVFYVLTTKIGLALFSMIFARASELINSDDNFPADPWDEKVASLYGILESNYLNLLIGAKDLLAEEWAYFAVMVVHINSDQRVSLLTEIRDKVMESLHLPEEDPVHIEATNFLSALGLTPSQIASLMT